MPYWEDAEKISSDFYKKIEREEKEVFNKLVIRWNELYKTIEDKIEALSSIEVKTPDQIYRLSVYKEFLKDAQTTIAKYSVYSVNTISKQQKLFADMGIETTQKQIELVKVRFQKLNPDAINYMVGNSFKGGRLYDLLQKSYPETTSRITKTLIDSIAFGVNPRKTARLLKQDMAGNAVRALRIARTESMHAYREAGRKQMIESGVVSGWERIEQDDACDFCKERNGKIYPLSHVFESHPNCRGTSIPVVE